MRIHQIILLVTGIFVTSTGRAQTAGALQKSWVLLQSRCVNTDTLMVNALYKLRLDQENMYMTIAPNGREIPQPYEVAGDVLKGRFVNYTIESVTDSSLVLVVPHNRKMYFLAEGHSPCGDFYIIKAGEFNGRPYYKSMRYLMPKLSGEPLFTAIEKAIHFDRQKKKIVVGFSFVVDEKGFVQDAKIQRSFSAEIDAIVLDQLQKSSGKWQAPAACGIPVATGLSYTFEYDPTVH